MKSLFLFRGVSGCGKTTTANILLDRVHEADSYFYDNEGNYNFDVTKLKEAHQLCQENTEASMKEGCEKIGVSNTFTREWEMKPYYDLAHKYGYIVFSIIVENRHGGENEHGVPQDKLEEMKKRFEIIL